MDITDNKGLVSEWNEGIFKTIRLHDAQQLINQSKIFPLRISIDGMNFNFELWIAGINILYGEGQSKYSSEEIEEIEKLKEDLDSMIAENPPYKIVQEKTYSGMKKKILLRHDNFNKIKKKIEEFEKKVKYYNEIHGLSTRNAGEYDPDEI